MASETTTPKPRATRAKRSGGRKQLSIDDRATILELVAAGSTVEEASAQVGFTARPVQRYAKDHPKYREALDRALDTGAWLRDTTIVFTEPVREQFLDLLRNGSKPRPAARQVGCDPGNVMRYVGANPQFRAKVTEAMSEALDRVEAATFVDAITGGSQGQRAREFILKNKRPKAYRDVRLVGHGGIDGEGVPTGPVSIEVDDKAESRALLAKALLDPQFVALAHAVHAERDEEGTE